MLSRQVERMLPLRIAVIIATKARPQATNQLLRLLENQTLGPSVVMVSATESADIERPKNTPLNVEYIFGSAGSSRQRNRALERIRDSFDIVIFFDDDFAPSPTWLEHCANAFVSDTSVVGMSGLVVRNGTQTEEISWEQAKRLISSTPPVTAGASVFCERTDLYGCNMAYRVSAIRDLSFDERLVLYGWMEDKDFSRRAAAKGRLVGCKSMVGVHLGLRSGRVSGKTLGYSQIVNAWYLHKKGVLTSKEAWSNILRALLANGAKTFWPERQIDRLGRFRGNLIGVGDLLCGRCCPEKAAEL